MVGFKWQVCDFNISEQEEEAKEEWKSIYTLIHVLEPIFSICHL